MSEKRRIKANELDVPAGEYIPGHLGSMQDVLFGALDQGVMTQRTLQEAAEAGKETLAKYSKHEMPWIVYADIQPDTCIQRNQEYTPLEPHLRYPTNIYGEIIGLDVDQHPDGRTMLYAQVEGMAVGQYEQYIVPIAYAGDSQLDRSRVMDMPVLTRDSYEGRVYKKELARAVAFAEFVGESVRSGYDVAEYLSERLQSAKKSGIDQYTMSLNLMFEDMFGAGCPFLVNLHDCWVLREYNHESDESEGVFEHMVDEQARIVRLNLTRISGTDLKIEWVAELEDGDQVVSFDSDFAGNISFSRSDIYED